MLYNICTSKISELAYLSVCAGVIGECSECDATNGVTTCTVCANSKEKSKDETACVSK